MTTLAPPPAVAEYANSVRAHLEGLDPETLDELTGGLEADLAEALSERSPDGAVDLYITPEKFHHQFAADLPADQAALMAIIQRPATERALSEHSGDYPLWKTVPSWFIYGELDHNIPAGAHYAMADRASAVRAVEIPGASHVVGISHPDDVVQTIRDAVRSAAHA